MRKLLPYEYDLIDTLGVSKEEYLEFIALQEIYNDPKQGTIFDIRNDPVTAIVLTIVGILFQVVSVLFLQPKLPSFDTPGGGGQAQRREQKFSPRFGFNSQQDLAKYGDPVNLIYTDTSVNTRGGVRVAGSLVWSAVRSYGSNQFVQLLMALGGRGIGAIDINKCAFGQTALSDITQQNRWMYFRQNATGFLQWANEINSQYSTDPTLYGSANDNPYRLQTTSTNTRVDGFSQAYSPASQNVVGVYGIVPINVLVYQRNAAGGKQAAELGIVSSLQWAPLQPIPVNTAITVTLKDTRPDADDVNTQAQEARRALASTFDESGIFKLGSARFKVQTVSKGSTDDGDMIVTLSCTEAGYAPPVSYSNQSLEGTQESYRQSVINSANYVSAQAILAAMQSADGRLVPTGADGFSILYGLATQYRSATVAEIIASGEIQRANYKTTPGYRTKTDFFAGTTTYLGNVKVRALTTTEIGAYNTLTLLDASIANYDEDSYFYTKALAKFEEASYQTLQQCHIVDLAVKGRVNKRLSGRQSEYGSERRAGYPVSDNGIKNRTSLFLIKYKEVGKEFAYVPGIFAISRATDNDNFIYLKFNSGFTAIADAKFWQFKLEPVADPLAEIAKHPELRGPNGQVTYLYIENSGEPQTWDKFQFTGRTIGSASGFPPLNENPSGINEWDLFNLDADTQITSTFDNGPELSLTCVTEQTIQPFSDFPKLYNQLSLIGFNIFSGRNLQDLRSFTAYVTQGRWVKRLRTSGRDENNTQWGNPGYNYLPATEDGPTCFAPDIFYDSAMDDEDGIGKYANGNAINIEQLAKTKLFCKTNGLYMDGIIADPTSWREFWVGVAPYSLLEFARIGGQETLVPAVPYNVLTGAIDRTVNISALFNQGNIIEDSYREEHLDYGSNVQDLIASVTYRDTDINGIFARNRTVEIRRRDSNEADSIRQTFDLSQFVTNRDQAILYGKLLCNTRHWVRRAVEFRTFPTQDPLSPGAFIYVDIGQNQWDGIRTGMISAGGALNMPLDNSLPNGTYNFLLYQSGSGVLAQSAYVQDGIAATLASQEGKLFVLGTVVKTKRVFRVAEVNMDEEGEVTVRATEYPCTSDGRSQIADFNASLFDVR
ncbi:hypothetical protein UFOVP383_5 [uncultured Caudovirales phage]|uniref:Uncharacterized protein n=1 Tax=uncultured Caudovirales phage TaxID=2100421 RepID=A0A6J7X2J9_9CAUD|nr:hypothetical protein UFOVP383_5 [uncultured Caudovirales phage]